MINLVSALPPASSTRFSFNYRRKILRLLDNSLPPIPTLPGFRTGATQPTSEICSFHRFAEDFAGAIYAIRNRDLNTSHSFGAPTMNASAKLWRRSFCFVRGSCLCERALLLARAVK